MMPVRTVGSHTKKPCLWFSAKPMAPNLGEYTVNVTLYGYQLWQTTVVLVAGANFELNPALVPVV